MTGFPFCVRDESEDVFECVGLFEGDSDFNGTVLAGLFGVAGKQVAAVAKRTPGSELRRGRGRLARTASSYQLSEGQTDACEDHVLGYAHQDWSVGLLGVLLYQVGVSKAE